MSIFWTMYWLGFLGVPLVILFSTLFTGNGSAASNTHIWVYKGSNRKVKDATVEEVWKRQHPGKSWSKHQSAILITAIIFLSIMFLAFLSWLGGELFELPGDSPGLRLFWQIGAPLLGGLSAAIFYGIQSLIADYKSGFLKGLHIFALVLTAVGLVGALVLTFMKRPLPISAHWIWAPIGATAVFLILDQIFSGAKKQRASKGGGNLEVWVYEVMAMLRQYDTKETKTVMAFAMIQLKMGELDWQINNEKFFKMTEGILLDLIRGRPMSIEEQDIYYARDEVIKAVQAFYFYSIEKFRGFEIHPRIKKSLAKH